MVEIIDKNSGDQYRYDPQTHRVFRNDAFVSSVHVEPVFSGNDKDMEPIFSGLFIKSQNSILTLTGNLKPLTDIDNIR